MRSRLLFGMVGAAAVTLTGTVRTQAEKTEALQIARQVKGVTSVTDRLTVERRQ